MFRENRLKYLYSSKIFYIFDIHVNLQAKNNTYKSYKKLFMEHRVITINVVKSNSIQVYIFDQYRFS